MKILILKPSSLGDVIHALPVLRALRHAYPSAEIHWWIGTELLPLLEGDPDLTALIPFNRRRWWSLSFWINALDSIRQMRRKRFDLVVDLQGLARSGIFAWLAAGHLTIGLDDSREGARGFYDVAIPRPSAATHAVDWYLQVLRHLHVPVPPLFDWLPARPQVAAEIRRKWAVDPGTWVIINPGARWLNKRWPIEHFQALISRLATERPELRFAILGGKDDVPLGMAIARIKPDRCLNLAGLTSLVEMIEWIRLSRLVITNDTGPMHVAAALSIPVLALFGPTDPRRTGPYRQIEHVIRMPLPCSPCMKSTCANPKPLECLQAISPDLVADTAQRMLTFAPTSQATGSQ